ncbi:hypothetical protein LSCM4_00116 [Leishmania orientalis]|uniref:Inositol polyphosphate-related phosphatase domain-containing protein n=1 Tax=Leishmania orientalis TaxID=2249476 RepID=A0A836K944_9TRYP|nr:hypothetical protein LSCM4_00116 [Leishmania orientalis]
MTEYAGTPATKYGPLGESALPAIPPQPADHSQDMLAVSVPPSTRSIRAQQAAHRGFVQSESCSNNNNTCSNHHNSDSSAAGNVTAATAIGATFLSSSFGSTCIETDHPCGPLLRRIIDPAVTLSAPVSVGAATSDRWLPRPSFYPRRPSTVTDPRTTPGLTSVTPQTPVDGDLYPNMRSIDEDDGGASPPSRRTSWAPSAGDGADGSAKTLPIPTVEQNIPSGELKPSLCSVPSLSKGTGSDLQQRQAMQRPVMTPSVHSSTSLRKLPTLCVGDESTNSALLADGTRTRSSTFTHDENAGRSVLGATAGNRRMPALGSLASASARSRQRDEFSALVGGDAPPTRADDTVLFARETFPVPRYCPDDLLRGEDKIWAPGKPLRIAYVSWNMASKRPRSCEVSNYCIHPNAHLVVVGTQENGPYLMSNKRQRRWMKIVSHACLGGQYELVGKHHMWAVQMLVFARRRDVANYVSRAHASHVKTGLLNGLGGNKGGVAVGLVLSMTPKDIQLPQPSSKHDAATQDLHTQAMERSTFTTVGASINRSLTSPLDGGNSIVADAGNAPAVWLSTCSTTSGVGVPPSRTKKSLMLHDKDEELRRRLSVSDGKSSSDLDGVDNDTVSGDDEDFSSAESASRNTSFAVLGRLDDARRAHQNGRHPQSGINARALESVDDDGAPNDGTPESNTPNYMTLLFITAHLAAHQGGVTNRNKDYRQIVCGLQLGRRGPYRKFFKRLLRRKQVLAGDDEEEASEQDNAAEYSENNSCEEGVMPLRLPTVSSVVDDGKVRRDVTEEFDLTFFGGDLNYRINGTRKAIEYVIHQHRNIRSILINNDQLSLERARGKVFQGFQEGNLLFRPTYKYEVSAGGGVTLDAYNFSHKKKRLPAYCDRILFKKKMCSAARRVAIRLYTDVPNVRSSDHRPVVALFDVGTRAYTG